MARRRQSGATTISAVAALADVSRQTVSNVLNAPDRVAPDTAARVRAAIEKLGYRPNRVARNLRSRSSGLIGYRIAPGSSDVSPLLDRFLHSLTEAAREAGYHILLFTPADPAEELATYEELMRTGTVDGFVLAETYVGDERPELLSARGIPFACFGRPWGREDAGYHWVDVDGAYGTDAAVERLVASGHERIAFLGWPEGSGAGDDRAAGWSRGMARHGLATDGLRLTCEDTVDAASAVASAVLRGASHPTAFVCASDTLALGARLAAEALAPASEVAVIGFDDSPVTHLLSPPLPSIRQPIEEAGRTVVRMLLNQLKGAPSEQEARGVLLTPELILRD